MVDVVGYRPQRNKWLNCIDNINSIIFCASLNDYGKAHFTIKTLTLICMAITQTFFFLYGRPLESMNVGIEIFLIDSSNLLIEIKKFEQKLIGMRLAIGFKFFL